MWCDVSQVRGVVGGELSCRRQRAGRQKQPLRGVQPVSVTARQGKEAQAAWISMRFGVILSEACLAKRASISGSSTSQHEESRQSA